MKTKRYWLRGLLLGLLLSLIFFAVSLFIELYYFGQPMGLTAKIIYVFCFWPVVISDDMLNLEPYLSGFQILFLPLVYSFIGVVTGLLYGKIKNRNKNPQV